MTAITSTIFPDAEGWIRENVGDFQVDGIAEVYRSTRFNPDGITVYRDDSEEKKRWATMETHVKALQKLCTLIDERKLFVGGVKGAIDLVDPCNWDVEVMDAYFQLILHGEVIYG